MPPRPQFQANLAAGAARSTRPSSTRCWRRSTSEVMRPIRCSSSRWRSRSTTEDGQHPRLRAGGPVLLRRHGLRRRRLLHLCGRRRRLSTSAPIRARTTFALVGLSDTANVTLIYEKYGFSARLAYNWRDKFLQPTNRGGQPQPGVRRAVRHASISTSATTSTSNSRSRSKRINLLGETDPDLRPRREQALVRPGAAPAILPGRALQVLELRAGGRKSAGACGP